MYLSLSISLYLSLSVYLAVCLSVSLSVYLPTHLPALPYYVQGEVTPVVNYSNTTPPTRMGSGCKDHVFLTSVLFGGQWSPSRFCRFASGISIPGWVGVRAGLHATENILDPTGARTPISLPSSPERRVFNC
jgi:hypothetical protein